MYIDSASTCNSVHEEEMYIVRNIGNLSGGGRHSYGRAAIVLFLMPVNCIGSFK